jgi:hypothetical protein
MVIFLSVCIEGILQLFTNFYLQRKFLIFLRNDHDRKVVSECQLVDLCGKRERYRIERYRVKECWVLQNTHIVYQIIIK